MSSPIRQFSYEFDRPAGWLMLPKVDILNGIGWISPLLDPFAFTPSARKRLEADLDRAAELARAQQMPDRRRWVFVPDSANGAVEAVLNIDIIHASGISQVECLEGFRTAADVPGVSVWERSFDLATLAGRPAVSGRQLLVTVLADGEQQVNEYFGTVVFTPRLGTILKASISTPDLALFSDILEYGNRLIDGIRFLRNEAAA